MKQKVMFITIVLLALSNTIILYNYCNLKKEVLSYKENYKKSKKNMISMMLETDTNSKTYIQSTDSTWPSDGYMFNVEMSKCEQGSTLKWDEENKKVVMEGNTSDKCYVFFDKYSPIKINNYSITSSGNKITITIDATSGTGTISKYYYSKDDGVTYIESTSNNYVFTSLDKGIYKIKAYVEDSNGKKSSIVSKTIEITALTIADYIISQYNGTQGENGLYYHNLSLTNGAEDNSYRFAGANPNNYICFEDSNSGCQDDNLYRIIGVFDGKVKVIKNVSIGKNAWDSNESNIWSTSTLNSYLNTTYYNSLSTSLKEKIADTTWIVGGNTYDSIAKVPVSTAYQNEIVTPASTLTFTTKIGLMYVNDYFYSAPQNCWTLVGVDSSETKDYRAAKAENWIYLKEHEWTITRSSNGTSYSFCIVSTGEISSYCGGGVGNKFEVRPNFHLTSDVQYAGGTGTSSDPYRVG